jgi:hypothetical protein
MSRTIWRNVFKNKAFVDFTPQEGVAIQWTRVELSGYGYLHMPNDDRPIMQLRVGGFDHPYPAHVSWRNFQGSLLREWQGKKPSFPEALFRRFFQCGSIGAFRDGLGRLIATDARDGRFTITESGQSFFVKPANSWTEISLWDESAEIMTSDVLRGTLTILHVVPRIEVPLCLFWLYVIRKKTDISGP